MTGESWMRAASLADVQNSGGCMAVRVDGHTLALFQHDGQVFAVDNRCPHMGFPLAKGSVRDGILTCFWHYARFDLATGGTFDPWADDVRAFPAEIRGDDVWVNLAPSADPMSHQRQRLHEGLERSLSLVIAKAVIHLLEGGADPAEPFQIGLQFGTRYRSQGWGQGLTILTCMVNLLPHLDPEDRSRALYHGLSAVGNDTAGRAPRFLLQPLPSAPKDFATLKRWFRQFVEVRDAEGAERCLLSAIEMGAEPGQIADMLFAAATDHRYIDIGHPLDFTNKALEALDIAGWDQAGLVLSSLVQGYANAARMEESNAWRYPIDLIALLDSTFEALADALEAGSTRRAGGGETAHALRASLTPILLSDDPAAILESLLEAVRNGAAEVDLAGAVAYAAARRIAHFHTSNEFGDWDTALHTFTFASAVHQGLRRVASPDLLRGVFDAAMSIYLDRFLNIPSTPLPQPNGSTPSAETVLSELPSLLDRQQQVNEAGERVARYLAGGGNTDRLRAVLGRLLLREDRDFHTIQTVEAAFRQADLLEGTPEASHVLIAAARYLAAHSPTMRAEGQTFNIAQRLARGERLFEDEIA